MPGDLNGFDPFPSPTRYPFADFWPGPLSSYTTIPDYKGAAGYGTITERPDLWAQPTKGM